MLQRKQPTNMLDEASSSSSSDCNGSFIALKHASLQVGMPSGLAFEGCLLRTLKAWLNCLVCLPLGLFRIEGQHRTGAAADHGAPAAA